ncbi:RadC family protein [Cetobacterium sp. SF1]|uniref:RadC family protein n=1 Tax=unclassified Cetobacterium TaxID=2630983 RepID=UPI003CF7CAEA
MLEKKMDGHRSRLRERYLKGGYTAFQDYEILEMLLSLLIPRKDTKSLSKALLEKFKTIEGVLKADRKQLEDFTGISERIALMMNFVGDLTKYNFKNNYEKNDLTTFDGKRDLIAYLKSDIGFVENEQFMVLFLNSANQLIFTEVLFKGTIDRSVIYPRSIVQKAIYHNARSLIFAHNHPSGNIRPSDSDIKLTKELEEYLKVVDVKLVDHIIITRDSYLSFLEEGLIDYY